MKAGNNGRGLTAAKLRIVGGTAAATSTPPLSSGVPRGRSWGKIYLDEFGMLKISPAIRLLIILRCRSFRGRKTLTVNADMAAEAGVNPRHRSHYARRLEKLGLLRVENAGRRTLKVRLS